MDDFNPRAVQTLVILARAVKTLPWVPEPLVIEVRIRRGGSGHTSIQPHDHFGEFNIWTLFVIGLNLCESFHWLTNAHRLTNEKTHINIDQSQTEFKYWTYQSEAGFSCDHAEPHRRVLTSITRGSGTQGISKLQLWQGIFKEISYLKVEAGKSISV
jgi:hypothetical protein